MTSIQLFAEEDAQDWDSYVQHHPQGTIFHCLAWRDVVQEACGHRPYYLLAREDGDDQGEQPIVGILPLFQVKSLLFSHALLSVPFAETGGPLAESESVCAKLLDEAAELGRKLGVEYTELRNRQTVPGLPQKDLYVSFAREIYPNLDDNLQAIPRKSRRMVRVGLKSGLQAETGDHLLEDFYRLLAVNFHRLGTPIFPKRLFRCFLSHFSKASQIMLIRNEEGIPVAGCLSFFFRDRVMPYYAGSLTEYRNLAPNDFMYWKLLEYGWEQGYAWFDFGRSKEGTGSYRFKKHWGFPPEPLAYQYILNTASEIPNISPTNPKYQKQIAIWQKMPLWATKLVGPRVAKYLC